MVKHYVYNLQCIKIFYITYHAFLLQIFKHITNLKIILTVTIVTILINVTSLREVPFKNASRTKLYQQHLDCNWV